MRSDSSVSVRLFVCATLKVKLTKRVAKDDEHGKEIERKQDVAEDQQRVPESRGAKR